MGTYDDGNGAKAQNRPRKAKSRQQKDDRCPDTKFVKLCRALPMDLSNLGKLATVLFSYRLET